MPHETIDEVTRKEMDDLLDELAQIDMEADKIAAWEKAIGWTAPEDGIPGSEIPPFRLGGESGKTIDLLIKESPDVHATRVLIGDVWLQIYAGNHLEHGPFTILIEESKYDRECFDSLFLVHKGRLLGDNVNYWPHGSFSDV